MAKRYGGHDLYSKGAREWVSKTTLENLYGITDTPSIRIPMAYFADDTYWGRTTSYGLLYNPVTNTYFYTGGYFSDAANTSHRFTLSGLLNSLYVSFHVSTSLSPSNTAVTVYRKSDGEPSDAFSYVDPSDGVTKYLVRALIGGASFLWLSETALESAGYTLHPSYLYDADGDNLTPCIYDDESEIVETL